MWPDLRNSGFHTHNNKTHFSPSNNSCTCWLTLQPGIDAKSCPDCFCCGLFLRLVRRPRVYGSPTNGCISPWQADSWLYFTTRLADEFGHGFNCFVWYVEVKMTPMDAIWLALVKMYVAFAHHFVATHPPPTLPPCRSATDIGYTSKKLSKMAGNLASYSPNIWWIDRL